MASPKDNRGAVSKTVFAITVVVLLGVAAVGFGLYLAVPRTITTTEVRTTTQTLTTTQPVTATVTTTVPATVTTTVPTTVTTTVTPPLPGVSGGFLEGNLVSFLYTDPPQCTPPTRELFPDQPDAASATECEVGAAGTFTNAVPVWLMVPAHAGLSLFGVADFGATEQGYSRYNEHVLLTHCGAGGSPTGCPQHPPLLYSPAFAAVEEHLGITEGVLGLPQGVLPTPAHSHILDSNAGGANVPWFVIAVLVFDPNIMPNAATGECTPVAPSSLGDPTGNCLTSLAALELAMSTQNAAIAEANEGNPIWEALGGPTVQVVIPGVDVVSQIRNANSNVAVLFAVEDVDPYPPQAAPGLAAFGIAGVATVAGFGALARARRSPKSQRRANEPPHAQTDHER